MQNNRYFDVVRSRFRNGFDLLDAGVLDRTLARRENDRRFEFLCRLDDGFCELQIAEIECADGIIALVCFL